MIEPKAGWTQLETREQRMDYLMAQGLTSKSLSWERALTYTGYFTPSPVFCALAGYVSANITVVRIDGALHCVNTAHLRDMQLPVSASIPAEAVYVDVETTGLDPQRDQIIEIAARRVVGGKVVDSFHEMVFAPIVPAEITDLTGITGQMVADARHENDVMTDFSAFLGDAPVIAHNVAFDAGMIAAAFRRCGLSFQNATVDSLKIARMGFPYLKRYSLEFLAKYLNIDNLNAHRAMADVDTMMQMVQAAVVQILQRGGSHTTVQRANRPAPAPSVAAAPPPPQKKSFSQFKRIDHKAITPTCAVDDTHPLFGKDVVFTGELRLPREEAMQRAVDCGAVIKTSVSKKTSFVVVGKQDASLVGAAGISSKERRAQELIEQGVDTLQILDEDTFLALTEAKSE